MVGTREHWQAVYATRAPERTSWHRPHLDASLRLIDALALLPSTPVIDVGAGRSTLADDLVDRGFESITLLDLSGLALAQTQSRVGAGLTLIESDVLEADLPEAAYGLWHDRAVFHFMPTAAARAGYVRQAARALVPGGFAVVCTFAEDGPVQCSGLPVCRYSADALAACFGRAFEVVATERELHETPSGTVQPFTCLVLRRTSHAPE